MSRVFARCSANVLSFHSGWPGWPLTPSARCARCDRFACCDHRRVGFGGSELAVTASVAYFAMGLLYEVRGNATLQGSCGQHAGRWLARRLRRVACCPANPLSSLRKSMGACCCSGRTQTVVQQLWWLPVLLFLFCFPHWSCCSPALCCPAVHTLHCAHPLPAPLQGRPPQPRPAL